MMKIKRNGKVSMLCLFAIWAIISCQSVEKQPKKPNVILIMADDMGYECLSAYGSTSYSTPILDQLATKGIRFDNCISQPLCTPSRVKIMTGLYNYRNYDYFGYLGVEQYTFANMMRDAGYATCIAGKWQLNGLAYKEEIKDWHDSSKPNKLGFDEYSLWQLTQSRSQGERFANPLIEQNGKLLERDSSAYGPDIFADFVIDFIDRKKDSSFFVYYPMVLVHDPFVPTPDSKQWEDPGRRYENDTSYFKDMVAYTDKIIGRIQRKLEEENIEENTILIFTGDNGTHRSIVSNVIDGKIKGAKGNTIDHGTHVPLIVSWPAQIKDAHVQESLVEFSDFFATFADIVGSDAEHDGLSFLPLLKGESYNARNTAFVHYDPKWGKNVNQYRNQFVRSLDYKLYQDGKLYHLPSDILEEEALELNMLSEDAKKEKQFLDRAFEKHPTFPPAENE